LRQLRNNSVPPVVRGGQVLDGGVHLQRGEPQPGQRGKPDRRRVPVGGKGGESEGAAGGGARVARGAGARRGQPALPHHESRGLHRALHPRRLLHPRGEKRPPRQHHQPRQAAHAQGLL